MSQETKIKDADGDDLVIRWDMDGDRAAITLSPLHEYAALDLAGIAKLRAVLDEAEAAFRKREALMHGGCSYIDCVKNAPADATILAVFGRAEQVPAMPADTLSGQDVFVCRSHDLQLAAQKPGLTDVWLSKYVVVQAGDIPRGIRVWREEARIET